MVLSRVLALPAQVVRATVPALVRAALPGSSAAPAHEECPGGVRIALRVIGGPGTDAAAAELEERLGELDGVARAEVNGALGCVFVACDPSAVDVDALTAVVAELDGAADGGHNAVPDPPAHRHVPAALRAGVTMLGAGLALTGRATRIPALSAAAPALVNLVNTTPRFRGELERLLGPSLTAKVTATSHLVCHTLAQHPAALFVSSVVRTGRYLEALAVRYAWERREPELTATPGAFRHIRAAAPRRPLPLPHGPIERYSDVMGPLAMAVSAATRLRGPGRALTALAAATPTDVWLGREMYAGAVGRALGGADTIVLRHDALRVMDRVDTVVIDAAALTVGGWTVDGLIPLPGGTGSGEVDEAMLHARLHALLGPAGPVRARRRGGWAVRPGDDLTLLDDVPGGPAEADRWRELELTPVVLTYRGTPVAVAALAPRTDPLAAAVVTAARGDPAGEGGCTVLLAGTGPGLARRFGADGTLAGGTALPEEVRRLQREGHGVAVLSRGPGLAEADLGIGVLGGDGAVPWHADVLCGLDGAYLLLACLSTAREVSGTSVRISAVGRSVATALAVAGPAVMAVRAARMVSTLTSLTGLAAGLWAGRGARRVAPPPSPDGTPWHAMPAEDVLAALGSSPQGIAEEDAEGRRTAPPDRKVPGSAAALADACAEELANPLTPVLVAGAAVSALIGSVLDAGLIATVAAANALLGGAQRVSADRARRRLAEATAARVRLLRPGGARSVTADELVVGDVVELHAGDAVPADCRVVEAVGLEVDESSLTGESGLVAKSPATSAAPDVADRRSMVYRGTTVAAGHGRAVVVAIGEATEAGRSAWTSREGPPPTGVELRLRELSRRILPVVLGAGAAMLGTDLLRGTPLPAAFASAVSLAVAAVPEGLPLAATVAELAAARRLSAHNTLVPNPSTIEALGRVDVLCFDKTGTLTEGRLALRRVSDGHADRPIDEATSQLRRVVAAGLRSSPHYDGRCALTHPTDRGVVEGARRIGVTPREGIGPWRRVDEMPFEPGRGYHAVLGVAGAEHLLSVKGAPEVVLTRCTHVLREGERIALSAAGRAALAREAGRLGRRGYRVLAVAERSASARGDLDESRVAGLCFLGFLCLADPVRPTAAESVERLIRAGVRIIMITGDHPSTAAAIAAEVGALNGMRVVTGPELDALDDDALALALPEISVFARVTPAHKARIVTALRRAGRVVAVTGDGANDAPAIRIADAGIALGARATPAAREAADVVVTDDRIETIVAAIIEGRAMWTSVRDALGILLGGNVGEVVFTLVSSLLGGRSALNARQLLLVNLLTDMVPAMVVAARPPATADPETLLTEGPEASLGSSLVRDIRVRAAITAGAATVAWLVGRATGPRGRADSIGLAALVAAQLFQTLVAGCRDRMVLLATLGSLVALGVVLSVPVVSLLFGSWPLDPGGWGIGLGVAAAVTAVGLLLRERLHRAAERGTGDAGEVAGDAARGTGRAAERSAAGDAVPDPVGC